MQKRVSAISSQVVEIKTGKSQKPAEPSGAAAAVQARPAAAPSPFLPRTVSRARFILTGKQQAKILFWLFPFHSQPFVPAASAPRGRGGMIPRGRGGVFSGASPYVGKSDNRPTLFLVKNLPQDLKTEEQIRAHFSVCFFFLAIY